MLNLMVDDDGQVNLHLEGDSETLVAQVSVSVMMLLDNLEQGLVKTGVPPKVARLTRRGILDATSTSKGSREGIC